MRELCSRWLSCVLVLSIFGVNRGTAHAEVVARLTQPVDNAHRITLQHNVHRLARAEFEQGVASPNLALDRMLLVLKRSPEQASELDKFLDNQQDKDSPDYRRWLTPDQFGERFGPASSDIEKIVGWLQNQGFHDIHVGKGRTIVEFSGTAAQVQAAFQTSIRKFVVNGEEHWANAQDPSIPAALAPAVEGVFTMHNFLKRPMVKYREERVEAQIDADKKAHFTAGNGLHALVPADFYKIYNLNPLGSDTGKVAIVGRSNINLQDVTYFHYWTYDQSSSANIIVNGPDPGNLGGGEEVEAVLDTTWASVVAPSGWVTLVVSQSTATTDGVDLSELYIIDNNLAGVMSESFGSCEANFTSAEAAGISALAQQAAAQGITYVVAAGDAGAAGCDDPNNQAVASHSLSVNMLSSTPYNLAVGGTIFNEGGNDSRYWSPTNDSPTLGSARSYIPEKVWNESCAAGQSGCGDPNIWAGGGGASIYFSKPSWQAGVTGIPTDNVRHVPDVALTSAMHDPYLICLRGSCVPDSHGSISFAAVGGTSAATPAFAGMMALVSGRQHSRLGQPNYILYRLAAGEVFSKCNGSAGTPASTCVFNDVTSGNNAVPGEANYGTGSAKYQSGIGYDQATGLGSINVTNLINQWNNVTFSPTTTSFSITPMEADHGSAFTVSGQVTPNSGTGKPTGHVWLSMDSAPVSGNFTVDLFTLDSQGSYSGVTHLLPGGIYNVVAHYVGDQIYAPSDSSPEIQMNIHPEESTTTFSVLAKDGGGQLVPFTGGPYGTPIYFQTHVEGVSGYGKPTQYVNFYDNASSAIAEAWLDPRGNGLSAPANAIPVGPHVITASYYGDLSFNSSTATTSASFTISPIATTTTLESQKTAEQLLLNATITANSIGNPATGVVTFSSGSSVLGSVPLMNGVTQNGKMQVAVVLDATQFAPGQYNVTASYPGDGNYLASTSTALPLNLVADFAIGNRGSVSQTVRAGQTASYINDLAVMPFFGYSGEVKLTCSSPAAKTQCTVTPDTYSLTPGVEGIGNIYVSTTAATVGALTPPKRINSRELIRTFGTMGIFFALVMSGTRKKQFLAGALLLMLAVGLNGCGGANNGGGGGNPPPAVPGTPAGTYTITVTATSASTTHTTTLTMIVQ